MKYSFILTLSLLLMIVFGCSKSSDSFKSEQVPLKQAFSEAFLMGTALNEGQIFGRDQQGIALTKTHFNAITPENVMKWERIHPEPNTYQFKAADRFVEFGEENDLFMAGHTLIWHSQVPDWVFEDEEGNKLSRNALLERMRNHIHTVVGRYAGRVDGWDVVNEALNDDGSYRESRWYTIIGKDYLIKAFQFAREADPNAELYYNDYSLELPEKRAGAVRLVQYLQQHDAPITGIGTQGHFNLKRPELNEVEQTITEFADLGIDVMVTELDIDVLPSAMDNMGADISASAELQEELNPYKNGLPDSVQQQLAERYANLFEVFMSHQDAISRVTFWGVTDGDSWKNNWPVRGRTNYPLLFNRQDQPKPAFDSVIQVASEFTPD